MRDGRHYWTAVYQCEPGRTPQVGEKWVGSGCVVCGLIVHGWVASDVPACPGKRVNAPLTLDTNN